MHTPAFWIGSTTMHARALSTTIGARARTHSLASVCVRCLFRVAAICFTKIRKHFNGYCLKPSGVETLRKTTITAHTHTHTHLSTLRLLHGSRIAAWLSHPTLSHISHHYRMYTRPFRASQWCQIVDCLRIVMAEHAFIRDYFFQCSLHSSGCNQYWRFIAHKICWYWTMASDLAHWWCVDKALYNMFQCWWPREFGKFYV